MAVIVKASGYFVDPNAKSPEEVHGFLKDIPIGTYPLHQHQEAAFFEWSEDHPLNNKNCDLAECEKFFLNKSAYCGSRHIPRYGDIYEHFKGKLVEVVCVGRDSEHPDSLSVVYRCPNGVYIRPLAMFLSEVDHKKYPDAKQKWRFRFVCDLGGMREGYTYDEDY